MGEIVAAIFTTHVPRLMIHDPEARRAYMGKNVTTFYDAMESLERERLRALEFDTFVLIDTHWFTTLEYVLNAQGRLRGLYTSEELPQMIHEYSYDYPGDPELATAIVEKSRAGGLRAIASGYPTLPMHYPTLNVMHYFNPGASRRVLPMGVCQTAGIPNDVAFGVAMGAAIRASQTVTFGFAKFGHVSYPGAGQCGELRIVDIGFATRAIDEIAPRGRFLERADLQHLIRARPENSHKGMYGHPLVIAGSRGKSGAVLLASRAALRTGAGLVTAAMPESIQPIVAAGQAELMTEPIADRDGHFDGAHAPDALKMLLDGKNALIVGPGIGVTDDTKRLIEWLISDASEPNRPMLIDADGLNALAAIGCESLKRARGPIVLTPHPGEASRLLGVTTAAINDDRVSAARTLAERTGATVLIKGARSVIASPDGDIFVNSTGNPGMSTPGMGDALSGIVGAMLGQHLRPLDALALGVFLHGYAADRVATRMGRVGYIAGDLIDELPAALEALIR